MHTVAPRVGAWIETHIWRRSYDVAPAPVSHPVWVRGLKHGESLVRGNPSFVVAPRVGAWIETYFNLGIEAWLLVAPRVGAWIETGLKESPGMEARVAPRVGAWIETLGYVISMDGKMSHPVWVRGLKLERRSHKRIALGRTPCGCVD